MRSISLLLVLFALGCQLRFGAHDTPHQGPELETIAELDRRPTTIAVSGGGRLFINFPNWWSQPRYAVAEMGADGELIAYPDAAWNAWDGQPGESAKKSFVCVQALYIDRCGDRLWIVDSGNPLTTFPGVVPGGPKLVSVELSSGKVDRVIHFGQQVVPSNGYLNDVRVDRRHQAAYLTDSGSGALVVVDLETGTSRRVLAGHPSTRAESCVVPTVGGQPWTAIGGFAPRIHADGIALGPRGDYLYYHALTARTLYRVPAALLRDPKVHPALLAKEVQSLGQTSAVDGMFMDLDGKLYMTAIEHDAIERRLKDGSLEVVVRDKAIQWPDAVLIAEVEGRRHLYFSASKIHKGWAFNSFIETRTEPFEIFRIPFPPLESSPPRSIVCPKIVTPDATDSHPPQSHHALQETGHAGGH